MFKYIRIIFRCLWYVIYIYPTFIYYVITKKKTPYEKRYAKTKKTLTKLSRLLDIEYHVTGYDKLDPKERYYFAPNHQSFLDSLSMIILTEGRYHQVKRMFLYYKATVISLNRIKMGNLYDKED